MYSTDLKIFRLQYSGISPEFSPDIKEYYLVVGEEINNIDITAVPEDNNAYVTIVGNENLKYGINEIKIEVQNEGEYAIYNLHVTKTNNIEMANANLENLAIRQGILQPEFDPNITKYKLEVKNDVYRIDLYVVPERQNARTETIMNYELEIGSNNVQITVYAEDGITKKVYEVDVYRRSEQEEMEYEKNMGVNAERLSAILNKNEDMYEYNYKKIYSDNLKENGVGGMVFIGVAIIIAFLIGFYVKNKSKKMSK